MGLVHHYINGQTPLDEEEKEGLLISSIIMREQLDEFEQQNIEEAVQWMFTGSFSSDMVLTEKFVKALHKRMYGHVWVWAGKFRRSEKNIGVKNWQIATSLRALCEDTTYWIRNRTYSSEEIAIRFKHRLVSIHCFPNGNGRHSRLMADILMYKMFKLPLFSWGSGNITKEANVRTIYLNALKAADQGEYGPLMAFVKS